MNTNFFNSSNFQLDIHRLPSIPLFVKSIRLPGMSSTPAVYATPFSNIPFPGDHTDYESLSVTFFVDEELRVYKELFAWYIAIYFPQSFDQYKVFSSLTPGEKPFSDMTVSLLSSHKRVINTVTIKDAFPISMSGFDLTYENEDTINPTLEVTFALQSFDIK